MKTKRDRIVISVSIQLSNTFVLKGTLSVFMKKSNRISAPFVKRVLVKKEV
jgi:hypothetical protein